MKIIDDIDALVGAAGKSLCRIHQQFYLVIIFLADIFHLIGMEEEFFCFFIHKLYRIVSFQLASEPHMLIYLQKYCIFRNYSPTTWFLLHIIIFMLFPIIMPKKKKAATICRNCLAQCGPARA
jgi:hypothetical protein